MLLCGQMLPKWNQQDQYLSTCSFYCLRAHIDEHRSTNKPDAG